MRHLKLIERILIVGLGSIGTRHLRLARELFPKADIKVLRHLLTNEIPEFSDGCISSFDEAIAFAPQIAVIANPATSHLKIAQALAEVGVHLLIEKPISDSLKGIAKLMATSKLNNTVLVVGYNLRFSPSLNKFRELVIIGEIGKVMAVRCEVGQYLPSWRPGSDYRLGVSARKELGGGALLELSHELDYIRWIFGDVQWIRAKLSRQSSLEIDVEDSAFLTMGFLPDIEGRQIVATANLDFVRHDHTRTCTAIGENGSLRWDGLTGVVSLFEKEAQGWKEIYRHEPQGNETYLAEWRDFLECINENRTPITTCEDGLRVLEIIEAARLSSASGVQFKVVGPHKGSRFTK